MQFMNSGFTALGHSGNKGRPFSSFSYFTLNLNSSIAKRAISCLYNRLVTSLMAALTGGTENTYKPELEEFKEVGKRMCFFSSLIKCIKILFQEVNFLKVKVKNMHNRPMYGNLFSYPNSFYPQYFSSGLGSASQRP